MLWLKKLVFKLVELGLGLRPCFALQTRNPVFVNFRLSEAESDAVRRALPRGFTLRPLRFAASDAEPACWVSYNLYEIAYPRPEMAAVRKVRCEINTFVRDADGRDGVFVFCGSPFVSREEQRSAVGAVCDLAERLVILLYGCGRLTRLRYEVTGDALRINLDERDVRLDLEVPLRPLNRATREKLSDDYHRFNDVSFFNSGKTFDLVTVNSAFVLARFEDVDAATLACHTVDGPFFRRPPDRVYFHRGAIGYLVSALHGPGRASGAAP